MFFVFINIKIFKIRHYKFFCLFFILPKFKSIIPITDAKKLKILILSTTVYSQVNLSNSNLVPDKKVTDLNFARTKNRYIFFYRFQTFSYLRRRKTYFNIF